MDSKNLARLVGGNIAERRKQSGWTQEQLAERLGLSQESLSRMEKGIISPKFSRLQSIADSLDCQVSALFQTVAENERSRCLWLEQRLSELPSEYRQMAFDVLSVMLRGFEKEAVEKAGKTGC